jgi:hypothetical protein
MNYTWKPGKAHATAGAAEIDIAELTCYGSVSVMRSDMKIQHDTIPPGDARLPDALALFD